ncbi:DUF2063 domain-containing protein [Pseudomonas sp. SJZ131]|uniref:HvfC family RiPP maturation protein n=1 Tax=Pseudomonas sp. SJZ131 TaxID=2572895 RepID=UPI001199BA82|nr:putative DNA-binding domain-containing protein [Pseudomonas sp. SJZ131]TWD50402.1 hypothetical protein FBY12_2850 [Pseudomonas sp. SJZ131]
MDKSSLHQQQNALTRYLRDPENCAAPVEMDAARVQVYRDLVFNNLSLLLSGTFPVLVKILREEDWRVLLRAFLRDHRAQTPKFGEIAREFVGFIAGGLPGDWPVFMAELAHYEWVEMVLQQAADQPLPASDAESMLERPLRVSPLAWPLAYAWPVQLLGPNYQPDAAPDQPTLLLVRRAEDWSVKFAELSPLAWRLLQRIGEFPALDGRAHLQGLAQEAGAAGSSEFMENGWALLQQMHAQRVVGAAA